MNWYILNLVVGTVVGYFSVKFFFFKANFTASVTRMVVWDDRVFGVTFMLTAVH